MSTESVFISYSSKDAEFASSLANSLTNAGASVWIESINGENDEDVTATEIKSAKLFLIVTSNNALDDESLKQEKDFARENKIDRLLVKIEPCETENKMRWNKLPCIDLTSNKEEGMRALIERCGTRKAVTKSTTEPNKSEDIEKTEKIVSPEKIVVTVTTEPTQSTITNDEELMRKESLLVSTDEIESVRSLFKNQIKESKIAIGLFIAASFVISVAVFLIFKYDLFSTEEAAQVATTAENTYDKLTKFFPVIGGILPNAFSGISASKINEKKKRLALVDKLERTRDRIKNNLKGTPESEIKALEEKLDELITI